MLRITELKLPLEHPPEALREAIARAWAFGSEAGEHHNLQAQPRCAQENCAALDLHRRCRRSKNEGGGARALSQGPQCRADAGHQLPLRRPGAGEARQRPVVIGSGPCGLFAALILAQMGFRPIILERGKAVRERTKDTWGLWRNSMLNPESNVQFGEGGAGTFSDGKLYSQIKDPRHLGRKVLTEFVKAGAPRGNSLRGATAHRHLPLVTMVENMRARDRGAGRRISASRAASPDLAIEAAGKCAA